MTTDDTSMGGARAEFPSTLWSDLLVAADPAAPEQRAKLDQLLRVYWRPVYAYIRMAWRKPIEDAKDLTQAFFSHMLEKGYFARVRQERGSFRGYLKTALRHFLINAEDHASVRRPKGPLLYLDDRPEDWGNLGPVSREESPEAAYDREWFQSLMEGATRELEAVLAREKKDDYFEIFRRYCLEGNGRTYHEVGEAAGLKEADVRHRLEYVRSAMKRILRRKIREYVSSEEEIEPELLEALKE